MFNLFDILLCFLRNCYSLFTAYHFLISYWKSIFFQRILKNLIKSYLTVLPFFKLLFQFGAYLS